MRCICVLTVDLVVVCVWLTGLGTVAQAKTVHCAGGDVACLIAAIHQANASGQANTIRLERGTYALTAVDNNTDGNNALPSITGTLTIIGVGDAWNETVISSQGAGRLFHVAASGNLTLRGVAVAHGRADQGTGGGIFNRGVLVMQQSALDENVADTGGGLANIGGTVSIEDGYIFANAATHPGGGIYTEGGSVTIMTTTIAKNGGDGGGALEHVGGGDVTIVDSAIVDNLTGQGGGGNISFYGGSLQMVNVTLARNMTYIGSGGAGAIRTSGDVSLVNCTIVDNQALYGHGTGGIHSEGTVSLVNTILVRNITQLGGSNPPFASDCSGTLTSAGHNLIGDPAGCPMALQPTDLTGDPGLGDPSDNGTAGNAHYPLLPTSQVINAGDPQACPLKDQIGRPRAGSCDMGAIEFQGASVARR
jgi:hypothetical protein